MNRWQEIAWQGIEFEVPLDWNPSVIDGDERRGYLKIDDLEKTRIEVRWQYARSMPSIEMIVRRLVQRSKGRIKKEFPLSKMNWPLKLGQYLQWDNEVSIHCIIAYSEATHRVLMVQVIFDKGRSSPQISEHIFSSFIDSAKSFRWKWSIYGLKTELPSDFRLKDFSLKAGHIRLDFRKTALMLIVERRSFADIILKKDTLTDWVGKTYYPKAGGLKRSKARIFSHQAVRIKTLLPRVLWLRHQVTSTLTWRCPLNNKIVSLQYKGSRKDEDILEKTARRTPCHEETASAEEGGDTLGKAGEKYPTQVGRDQGRRIADKGSPAADLDSQGLL